MTRKYILTVVKNHCIKEYLKIADWVHNIDHIKTVVSNGRKICRMEQVRPKIAFLVELACWLHDLGRVGEESGLEFGASNHAEVSYNMSKQILKPFEKKMGSESVIKVLQAVREHNLPCLIHTENIVGKLLIDADRGAGISMVGVFSMLNYLKVVTTEPVKTEREARDRLAQLSAKLVKTGKVDKAIEKLSYLKDWYYGSQKQAGSGVLVSPLHTASARKLYRRAMREIEDYIGVLGETRG